jgi:hypothetical protein
VNEIKTKNDLVIILRAGMDRFLGESAPYWSKNTLLKLIAPSSLDSPFIKEALRELEDNNDIYTIYDDEVYFLITEKFVTESFGADHSIGEEQIKEIRKIKTMFNIE